MNAPEVVTLLSRQLGAFLPARAAIESRAGEVVITYNGVEHRIAVAQNIENNVALGHSFRESVRISVENALNELQDIVTSTLATPWPITALSPSGDFVPPFADLRKDGIHFGFVDEWGWIKL